MRIARRLRQLDESVLGAPEASFPAVAEPQAAVAHESKQRYLLGWILVGAGLVILVNCLIFWTIVGVVFGAGNVILGAVDLRRARTRRTKWLRLTEQAEAHRLAELQRVGLATRTTSDEAG